MKKLMIYGGQFNPIHIGHMLVASESYQFVQPDEFLFLPSYQSPLKEHNESYLIESERVNMLELAIKDLQFGVVDRRELNRKGTSYTFDTIKEIQSEYPEHQIYFIIGTDQYENLNKWKNIDELKEMLIFVVVNREVDRQDVHEGMLALHIPRIDVSSTDIRNRCKNRQSIKMLVTPRIETYIKRGRLYEN
ncbi:nicotinate (nicotinamide) nucleotide adenylyltransferase [Mammaliicoccus vitulinus]|nr:nicotinate (nicotinamide) nucleotide adenylyltransferase [Mammaliicoccus vitulinus]MBO3077267.1 nicotinate (nicotinamide) nucleotide adenylyltransferase [Mammaliicoccus vitulinus]MEB7656935.1 nicotinate (nicotinamide) nucleotide adenylyltransferase [Mammaliicoccus vitulinus]PNZ36440.1 nicotinate (nicotinamide) nucleotide adenylyltransferase [Mammaliicoccus vitulinus]QJF25277.1 nicotinate (nicotinamide) nucleotide adenylyltransferase [Mammaliicoccus vitulinus]QTN11880.1 nicotinate (nicotinam